MPDDGRKFSKRNTSTGTVPKTKYRNSENQFRERDGTGGQLNFDVWQRSSSTSNRGSSERNTLMASSFDEYRGSSGQLQVEANTLMASLNSSSANSRRSSAHNVPKCDNVTKYPDKKQIEDRLSQIRDYLLVTSDLMSRINTQQNVDGEDWDNLSKVFGNLQDSESKLLLTLESLPSDADGDNLVNLEAKSNWNDSAEHSNRENEILREQVTLQGLQHKAENRLRDARAAQDRLQIVLGDSTNTRKKEKNLLDELLFDGRDLEDPGKPRNESRSLNLNLKEKEIVDEIEALQNEMRIMHNSTEDRSRLLQIIDKRDAELHSEHVELQNKLTELQDKKMKVDELVIQLQDIEKSEEEDVGCQVRKIVSMKEQLTKLKDMLDIVRTTESVMESGTQEEQAMACDIYNTRAENFLKKDIDKGKSVLLISENRNPLQNDTRNKEININSGESQPNCNGAKPKMSSISEKLALQAELKMKKRELEELMGKHKASSSNLNHDVGNDNKSDLSASNSIFDSSSSWVPLFSTQNNRAESSDRYSSDGGTDDINEYSEIQTNQNCAASSNVPLLNSSKCGHGQNAHRDVSRSDFVGSVSNRTGIRNSNSTGTSNCNKGPLVSNLEQNNRQSVQKQLELIRSVCDSMLEQQNHLEPTVQHLRNNLTPSPVYSETRQYHSPQAHSMNTLNVVNPIGDSQWFPNFNNQTDLSNYQNWVMTNSLQTQAFMLNTLNQCCQMLWQQQKELGSLRNVVSRLQQQNDRSYCNGLPTQIDSSDLGESQILNHCRPSNMKTNHVPSVCSLPNLNHYNNPNITEPAYTNNNASRVLDANLNNASRLNTTQNSAHLNGGVLHAANANANQLPNQMWNGQALNNQVAPGNRANNYWDNFRSYSRQNLLSAKTNDSLQNLEPPSDRLNNTLDRLNSNPFALQSLSKSNSEQNSVTSSQENTPQRTRLLKARRSIVTAPPDVLNINQNVIKNEGLPPPPPTQIDLQSNSDNVVNFNQLCANFSNVHLQNQNCIADEISSNSTKLINSSRIQESEGRTKLFEELRENVYKEVASLISANECRPHFLIQLFRDLQLVSSDPLRFKTLQSIQMILTQSLNSAQTRLSHNCPEIATDQGAVSLESVSEFRPQSAGWTSKTSSSLSRNNLGVENDIDYAFYEVLPFLSNHEQEPLHHHLLASLKKIILESRSFKDVVRDVIFQKHFSNVLDDVLTHYVGKHVYEVKTSLLQSIRELLQRELSFMNLIQGTCDSTVNDLMSQSLIMSNSSNEAIVQSVNIGENLEANGTLPIVNGDLAEADQSHIVEDEIEIEEGAVGGIFEVNTNNLDLTASALDFAGSIEPEAQFQLGLDQVPTRLPTKSKSRSSTPNRDRAASRQDLD